MAATKVVEFIRSRPPYNAGERAGFPVRAADDLIARGYAREAEMFTPHNKMQSGAGLEKKGAAPQGSAPKAPKPDDDAKGAAPQGSASKG